MSPLVAVLAPLVGAVAIALSGDRPRLRVVWTVVAAAVTVATVTSMFPSVLAGEQPTTYLGALVPGIDLGLEVDAAGMVFAISAAVLWVLASSYSFGYVKGAGEQHQTRFFTSFATCVAATMGLAFSANLFTFFLFYELLTLATYPLVVHQQTPAAFAAGRRYLFTLLGGGTAFLAAVVIVNQQAPGTAFRPGGILDASTSDALIVALAALSVLGLGTKAAVMPLHGWLPRAMVAPTPVSALLHAVAVVKAGVFGFVRMFGYIIGPERLHGVGAGVAVAFLAVTTIVAASIIAFRQDQLKRRLAYSTIAHLSYIVLGLSLLSPAAWSGALLHLANHAVLKITLFFAAGAIYVTTGVDRVSQMDGIGRRMPFTMAAFALAAAGLVGLPPMGGFVSKWLLSSGTIDAGQPVLTVMVVGSGLLTAGYLLPVVHRAFLRTSDRFPQRFDARTDAAATMVAPLCITAVLGVAMGLGDVFRLGELATAVSLAVMGAAP
jgi:multicomponent Na+:H+ antiporter subunit D